MLSVAIFCCTTTTAYGKNMVMPAHAKLNLKETIRWQHRIIRHDRWVIATAKHHRVEVVRWHRKQLSWTKRELSQSLQALQSRVSFSRHLSSTSIPAWLFNAFMCIHRYEGAWNSNTRNGYYGGLQFGWDEWQRYGGAYAPTAYQATPQEQIQAGVNYWKVSGFSPWPNTARACGLL